jgi:hypothetical protein
VLEKKKTLVPVISTSELHAQRLDGYRCLLEKLENDNSERRRLKEKAEKAEQLDLLQEALESAPQTEEPTLPAGEPSPLEIPSSVGTTCSMDCSAGVQRAEEKAGLTPSLAARPASAAHADHRRKVREEEEEEEEEEADNESVAGSIAGSNASTALVRSSTSPVPRPTLKSALASRSRSPEQKSVRFASPTGVSAPASTGHVQQPPLDSFGKCKAPENAAGRAAQGGDRAKKRPMMSSMMMMTIKGGAGAGLGTGSYEDAVLEG